MQFANKYRLHKVFDCSLQKHRKGVRKLHITSNRNLHSNQYKIAAAKELKF